MVWVVSVVPSMKVPPKRKGNRVNRLSPCFGGSLNESPSEKEGKSAPPLAHGGIRPPSMKVPPKRKGNISAIATGKADPRTLNESPSEKEGKCGGLLLLLVHLLLPLNESPSEKEGKSLTREQTQALVVNSLNESPSEKEGK